MLLLFLLLTKRAVITTAVLSVEWHEYRDKLGKTDSIEINRTFGYQTVMAIATLVALIVAVIVVDEFGTGTVPLHRSRKRAIGWREPAERK